MVIAAFNPKGGVGKTTTAVNLAGALAATGRSVVLIDLEADMNASISLGVSPADTSPSISDALLQHRRPPSVIRPIPQVPNLHLITGGPALAEIDTALRHARQPERRLADVVGPLATQFDAVIIDSPAGFSLLPQSVTLAADHLVVPIRAEYSLESLAHLFRWYRDRRAAKKGLANVAGVLLTKVDHRRHATGEIVDIIRVHNRRGVFKTEIPDDPRAAEAPSHGIPLVQYGSARAAQAYQQFARELLQRISRRAR